METKNNSAISRTQLLLHQWDLNSRDYENRFTFNWRQISVTIDIRVSYNAEDRKKCVSFKFYFNGNYALYRFIYSNYSSQHDGVIPEIQSKDYRLDMTAGPFSFEICEEEIQNAAKPETIKNICDINSIGEQVKKRTNLAIRRKSGNRKKEKWFHFAKSWKVKRFEKPFRDDQMWFWVKRTFIKHYSLGILLYEYKLYAYCLRPYALTFDKFTCRRIYDQCITTGNGVCSYISFEIADSAGISRTLSYKGGEIEDIARIWGFMNSLRCYTDWEDYDTIQVIYNSYGVTIDEIEQQLRKELSQLGITREGERYI